MKRVPVRVEPFSTYPGQFNTLTWPSPAPSDVGSDGAGVVLLPEQAAATSPSVAAMTAIR